MTGRFGDVGGALAFDGELLVTDFAYFPSSDTPYTYEVWARVAPGVRANEMGVAGISGAHHFGLRIDVRAGGRVEWDHNELGVGTNVEHETPVVLDQSWHHYAVVHDPDPGSGQVHLYIDGLHVAEAPIAEVAAAGGGTWAIGGLRSHEGVSTNAFHGELDELVLHRAALDADYIANRATAIPRVRLHVGTSGGGGPLPYRRYDVRWGAPDARRSPWRRPDGLLSARNGYLHWWRFDQARRGRVVDITAQAAPATLADPEVSTVAASNGGGLRFEPGQGGAVAPALADDRFTAEIIHRFDADSLVGTLLEQAAVDELRLRVVSEQRRGQIAETGRDDRQRFARFGAPEAGWRALAVVVGGSLQAFDHGVASDAPLDLAGGLREADGPLLIAPGGGVEVDEVRLMSRALSPDELLSVRPTRVEVPRADVDHWRIRDTADVGLDGRITRPSGQLEENGWTHIGAPITSYNRAFPRESGRAIEMTGDNREGAYADLPRPSHDLRCHVWWWSDDPLATDDFGLGDADQDPGDVGRVAIVTSGARFRFTTDANESQRLVPGAPPIVGQAWYRLAITVRDGEAAFEVTDGLISGRVDISTSDAAPSVRAVLGITTGGGQHTARWDDFGCSSPW